MNTEKKEISYIKTYLPLPLQARSNRAVSQQEPSVGHLKVIWDSLKIDSGNSFVRLVTSSFPSTRVSILTLKGHNMQHSGHTGQNFSN